MSVQQHLQALEPTDLVDIYRHWAGEIGAPTGDEALVRSELARLMTDRDRVLQRYRELPPACCEFLSWALTLENYAVPMSLLDEENPDLPVKPFEVDAVAFALVKRGFLVETRDRSWMHYGEPGYRVPRELGEVLGAILHGGKRSLEAQLGLRAFLRTLSSGEIERRAEARGVDGALVEDRAGLVAALSTLSSVTAAIESLPDATMRSAVSRLFNDLGGMADAKHLQRLGFEIEDLAAWREALEARLLGTVLDVDLTDVGLQLGEGSVVLFLDVMGNVLEERIAAEVEEDGAPAADVLADIAAARTFLDHHSVRVTREGSLYRATRRKMESEVLSPGTRVTDPEDALDFVLQFLDDAELTRSDRDGRLRTTSGWDDFESRGPVDRTDLLLTYLMNDVRGVKGAFHQTRMRRIFVGLLRERETRDWQHIRPLAALARNQYLQTLDREVTAERFQKRHKYATLPPLVGPGLLLRELVDFASARLPLAGIVEINDDDDNPPALRLTRLGAAALGLAVEEEPAGRGALIVTADFEIVLFPEAGGIDLMHEISRFARREKADYSIHYRIDRRSVQEAAAAGMSGEQIVAVLTEHGRHAVPQPVAASICEWSAEVTVLQASTVRLLRAPTKAALDAALKIRELKAIARERLNDTTLELSEDPSTARVAEALRGQGFFLR